MRDQQTIDNLRAMEGPGSPQDLGEIHGMLETALKIIRDARHRQMDVAAHEALLHAGSVLRIAVARLFVAGADVVLISNEELFAVDLESDLELLTEEG